MIPAKILIAVFLKIHKRWSQESWVMIQQNNQVESILLDFKDTALDQNWIVDFASLSSGDFPPSNFPHLLQPR